ncbi:MAG: alkaline phosphatase D family protein [Roseibacillus sp.]
MPSRLPLLCGSLCLSLAQAEPILLVNPSAEINGNTNGSSVAEASLLGWEGTGKLQEGDNDYGNGRWKLSFEETETVRQLTSHQIQTGAAYSIRLDAVLSSDVEPQIEGLIVGGSLLNGDFNSDISTTDSRDFASTPDWFNLDGSQGQDATRNTPSNVLLDGTRNAVVSDSGVKKYALDTNYDLTEGEVLQLSYQWRDASGWDSSDQIRVTIFTTSNNTPTGVRTDLATLMSGTPTVTATFEQFSGLFPAIPASAAGKRLFIFFEGVDGDNGSTGFARLDNFSLQQFSSLLIGPYTRNGDFNDDVTVADSRTFDDTPFWTNLTTAQSAEATRTNILFDGTRNAVLYQNNGNPAVLGNDTGYNLITGDVLTVSFLWRDAFNWADASDRVAVSLFTTANDIITGSPTTIQTFQTPTSTSNNTYESFSANFAPIPASANGKRLFVSFQPVDGDSNPIGYGRVENFLLSVNDTNPTIPEPTATAPDADLIVEAYVDNAGTPQVIASQTFPQLGTNLGQWKHHHFIIPAGTLDSFSGQNIGLQFRGANNAMGITQSVDNIRLDCYPSGAADGAFANDWNSSPNRVWPGPGYWGNRLADWEVRNGRINCILGSRDRRTLHRVGTSIRGNGENFTLSVRTGLHAGSNSSTARTGFLIGAGPNLDWRASLLVHSGLGRDFGTFLGINNNGAAVIEDLSQGAIVQVASGSNAAGGFPSDAKLELNAVYNATSKNYDLTLEVYNTSNVLLSTASTSVPSDRVLGSFGLLSHRGSSQARYWFDDFSGTGAALQPEPDRHLAIIGALHSLNWGELKMTAHLPPVDLTTTPPITLETWDGSTWNQIATAAIDNTDNLSSYTATFTVNPWDDTVDTPYRVGILVDGATYYWEGTVRRDPLEKNEIVVANTSCQRIADGNVQNNGTDWTPTKIWHPHNLAYAHIAKHEPDVLLALGDQIYEGQPTPEDSGTTFNRQYDYLYKWYLWLLQARDLAKDMPTISIPDDHDIYQGNLWGEGGISTTDQTTGGYEEPASWVRLVERTQASHLPAPDPYNPIQPAPPIAQGISIYFTGMCYGQVGFGVLEDRKFKTGPTNAPSDPEQLVLLGQRQKDFLKSWSTDWVGQCVKCVVSQSPMGNIHTHGSSGYGFFLNDRDSNGWPPQRRLEAWELFRLSRSFQLAGDQHVSTLVHHGIDGPADAGYSFASPAIANFFPRVWDPVHNAGGTTLAVSPYKGDFYLDGNGTLPTGEPNLNSDFPGHLRVVGAANPLEYYNQSTNIHPPNLHDRGAGYGMVRINKTTRQITFESWPLHADPEFPQTGTQFADWPVTINQADNDGRTPTGFLSVIDTLSEKTPVVSVYDENTDELIYSMRFPGNLVRPPVYDNSTSYRVEISYGDDPVSEVRLGQIASVEGPATIHSFNALHPSIISGDSTILQWNTESVATLTIDNGVGEVASHTVNGIGHLLVSPTSNTTYTLTLNGSIQAQATVLVFANKATWLEAHFNATELTNPAISGDGADPDGDGFSNEQEFRFQTDPRAASSFPNLTSCIVVAEETITVDFSSPYPLESEDCVLLVETSSDLQTWSPLQATSYQEIERNSSPLTGTTQITIRFTDSDGLQTRKFYRAFWE